MNGALAATAAFPTPHLCDFCDQPTPPGKLTSFPCRDFARSVIVRGDTLMIETCSCHTPIVTEPGDTITEQRVIGAWAACPACAAAIRANDPERLARLAAASFRRREPASARQPLPPLTVVQNGAATAEPASTWEAFYRAIHVAFWSHREGAGS